jgi:hypothetical protein
LIEEFENKLAESQKRKAEAENASKKKKIAEIQVNTIYTTTPPTPSFQLCFLSTTNRRKMRSQEASSAVSYPRRFWALRTRRASSCSS